MGFVLLMGPRRAGCDLLEKGVAQGKLQISECLHRALRYLAGFLCVPSPKNTKAGGPQVMLPQLALPGEGPQDPAAASLPSWSVCCLSSPLKSNQYNEKRCVWGLEVLWN